MQAYVQPILTAVWFFPFVAALMTLPYMFVQYYRHGSIPLLRTVILYSFVLYLMCAYFLTMLPLPKWEVVASLNTPYLQLTPFADVVAWVRDSGAVLTNVSTWQRLFNRDLFVMVANVAMTIPFGVYLRYYFGCSLKKTVLLSLGLSLIFELTQLSGLFFLYPRPYRLCETDDLITNTLGGLLGYWLAGPLMKVLPSRERIDAVAYRRSQHVSVMRRITAAVADWCALGFLMIAALVWVPGLADLLFRQGSIASLAAFGGYYAVGVFVYFMLGEWLQGGRTLGKRLMHLRLVDERTDGRPKLWQCVVRYALLYYFFAMLPVFAAVLLLVSGQKAEIRGTMVFLCVLLMAVFLMIIIWTIALVLMRKHQLPHGALSKTRNISTLVVTEEMLKTGRRRFLKRRKRLEQGTDASAAALPECGTPETMDARAGKDSAGDSTAPAAR